MTSDNELKPCKKCGAVALKYLEGFCSFVCKANYLEEENQTLKAEVEELKITESKLRRAFNQAGASRKLHKERTLQLREALDKVLHECCECGTKLTVDEAASRDADIFCDKCLDY